MRASAALLTLALPLLLGSARSADEAAVREPVVTPIPAEGRHPGYGVVESVTPVRLLAQERSAAAGGSAAARPMYRIAIRMADGSLQYRDLDRPEFKVGDNVLLTNAGEILSD